MLYFVFLVLLGTGHQDYGYNNGRDLAVLKRGNIQWHAEAPHKYISTRTTAHSSTFILLVSKLYFWTCLDMLARMVGTTLLHNLIPGNLTWPSRSVALSRGTLGHKLLVRTERMSTVYPLLIFGVRESTFHQTTKTQNIEVINTVLEGFVALYTSKKVTEIIPQRIPKQKRYLIPAWAPSFLPCFPSQTPYP